MVQTSFFIKRLSEFTGIKKLFHFFRVTYFEHSEGYLSLFTYRLLPFITFLYFFLVHKHNFQYKKNPVQINSLLIFLYLFFHTFLYMYPEKLAQMKLQFLRYIYIDKEVFFIFVHSTVLKTPHVIC